MDTWTFYCVLISLSVTVIYADHPFVTDCKDHDQVDCYKIRGTAECREEWVYEYCPLSCGVCGMLKPDSNKCEDHNRECDSIESSDHQSCKDIVIKEVCPKSCGVCGHPKHTHPPHLLKTTAITTATPPTTTPIPTSDNPTTDSLITTVKTDATVTGEAVTNSHGVSGEVGSQVTTDGQMVTNLNEFTTDQGITDVATDSSMTDRIGTDVTTDSMVTDNKVTTDFMVTDNEVTTNSMVTDNEVTTDSMVTDNEVTTDSMVANNEVTTDSMVTDNEVTTDSMVTNNEVTTDSMVTDNEVTTDSMVTDNEVTTYSMVTDNEVTTDSMLTNQITDGLKMTDSGITDSLETTGSRIQNTDEPVTVDGFTDELATQKIRTGAVTNQSVTQEHWNTNAPTDFGITEEGSMTPDVAVTNGMSMETQRYTGATEESSMTPEISVINGIMSQGHLATDGFTDELLHTHEGGSQGPTQSPDTSHRTGGLTASLTTKALTSGNTGSIPFTPPPLSNIRCQVCEDPFCRIGFANINYCYQDAPNCMNSVSFDANGKKTLKKKCASTQECDEKWINRSAKMTKCLEFDKTTTFQTNLECDFCCVKDNCNAHTLPNKDTLYTKQQQ